MPDAACRVMRRRLARREQLVRSRSRSKNEIHAVLMRRLKGRPPVSDLFGVRGRKWLRALELPVEEAETVECAMRHIEFLDQEIAEVERLIAHEALRSADARRVMTVPGVNVICAASFLAAIGDIRRFRTSRQLVAYVGLDPKVRQSGSEPARGGRISKRRSASARWALVEAAWSVVHQPGSLHAFSDRIRARRGHAIAVVAVARKLAVLFWCQLTRERGLRPRAAVADGQEAAPARDPRRRPDAEGQADVNLGDAPADAHGRARARPAGRGLLQGDGLRPAGDGEESGRERDTGALIDQALEGQVARQVHEPRRLLFDTSSARAHQHPNAR
jgi:hypothetical protein